VEKIDLACRERGILEITGRTGIVFTKSFFSVEKINKKSDEKK